VSEILEDHDGPDGLTAAVAKPRAREAQVQALSRPVLEAKLEPLHRHPALEVAQVTEQTTQRPAEHFGTGVARDPLRLLVERGNALELVDGEQAARYVVDDARVQVAELDQLVAVQAQLIRQAMREQRNRDEPRRVDAEVRERLVGTRERVALERREPSGSR